MQLEPQTQLTLTITEDGKSTQYIAVVVGPSPYGICTTMPQLLHRTYTPATGTPVVVSVMGAAGPVEFDSTVLGYRGSPVYMVIAEPRQFRRKEQRRYPRMDMSLPVSYLVGGPKPTGDATTTVNVSPGGLMVMTPILLPRGAPVTIFLDLPQGQITVDGRVAWSGYINNQRAAGFEFTGISEQDWKQLSFYLKTVAREMGKGTRSS